MYDEWCGFLHCMPTSISHKPNSIIVTYRMCNRFLVWIGHILFGLTKTRAIAFFNSISFYMLYYYYFAFLSLVLVLLLLWLIGIPFAKSIMANIWHCSVECVQVYVWDGIAHNRIVFPCGMPHHSLNRISSAVHLHTRRCINIFQSHLANIVPTIVSTCTLAKCICGNKTKKKITLKYWKKKRIGFYY